MFNKRGNYNFELLNCVRNGRSFQDGTFKGLGGVVRNGRSFQDGTFEGLGGVGDSRYVVHNPTVRRRGVLGSKHFVLGPRHKAPICKVGST